MPHGVGVFVGRLKTWDKGGFSKAQVWDSHQTETVHAGHRVFSCLHLHVVHVRGWGGAAQICPLQFSFLFLVISTSTPMPFQSVCVCYLERSQPPQADCVFSLFRSQTSREPNRVLQLTSTCLQSAQDVQVVMWSCGHIMTAFFPRFYISHW